MDKINNKEDFGREYVLWLEKRYRDCFIAFGQLSIIAESLYREMNKYYENDYDSWNDALEMYRAFKKEHMFKGQEENGN